MTAPLAARTGSALAALVLLAACGTTPPARFYALSPAVDATTARDVPGLAVRVATVRLPATVLRPQIVTRLSPQELHFAEYERWAEPLDVGATRVLMADLAALLPGARVFGDDDRVTPSMDVVVVVDVRDLQVTLGGDCVLEARWQLAEGADWRASGAGSYTVTAAGDEHADVVRALDTALGRLAGDLADAIAALPAVTGSGDEELPAEG